MKNGKFRKTIQHITLRFCVETSICSLAERSPAPGSRKLNPCPSIRRPARARRLRSAQKRTRTRKDLQANRLDQRTVLVAVHPATFCFSAVPLCHDLPLSRKLCTSKTSVRTALLRVPASADVGTIATMMDHGVIYEGPIISSGFSMGDLSMPKNVVLQSPPCLSF